MKHIFVLLLLTVLFPVLAFSAQEQAREAPVAREYLLDDANGVEFALYPGNAYHSNVDPKDAVAALPELENRMKQLPAQSTIHWTPARYTAAGTPLLFGHEDDVAALKKFCAAQGLALDIAPPSCKNPEGCTGFCKGAGLGKDCVPDGAPFCEKDRCACALTCR